MTRFIFIRHGQSIGNLTRRFLGHYDGELTELGREQARLAGEYLRSEQIDIAFASDLSRAYETGSIVAAPHGLTPIKDVRLREISAGQWENVEFSEIERLYPGDWHRWQNDIFNSRPTGGESVAELADRVTSEVWRLAGEYDGKTVLAATHATPIRALMREWSTLGALSGGPKWVSNASVTIAEYDFKSHTVKVDKVSECSYLGKSATDLPADV